MEPLQIIAIATNPQRADHKNNFVVSNSQLIRPGCLCHESHDDYQNINDTCERCDPVTVRGCESHQSIKSFYSMIEMRGQEEGDQGCDS